MTISRLDRRDSYKHVDLLIRAVRQLTDLPQPRLIIVGEGTDKARMETLCRDLDLKGLVIFEGHVSADRLDFLLGHRCDMFVLPSTQEGCGLVYLEAMVRAKPVIACRAAAVPELISDGKTGFLIKPNDQDGLTEAIATLAFHPHLRDNLGREGLRRAQQLFSRNRFLSDVERLLHADFIPC